MFGVWTTVEPVDIKKLSDAEFYAKQDYDALGMMNTAGKSVEERREHQARYMQAKYEWKSAKRRLDNAVNLGRR